ncbi:heavy metal-associated domain-containing protein [Amycolatopsis sp. YIM 10]|nr:heavy metal-associated domain-containing protein [Amycolatopsis sp. YIM 10]QFU89690.1 hypothetical protein YIM_22560 [Amycolatopsis sp. YIM 10]
MDVDISTGELTVVSEATLDAERVRAAIKDAGYEVAN